MLYQNEEPLVQRTCIKTANLQSDTNTSDKLETQALPPARLRPKDLPLAKELSKDLPLANECLKESPSVIEPQKRATYRAP